jgi:hypothetical protein
MPGTRKYADTWRMVDDARWPVHRRAYGPNDVAHVDRDPTWAMLVTDLLWIDGKPQIRHVGWMLGNVNGYSYAEVHPAFMTEVAEVQARIAA